jgi:hypothetical protein
MGGFQLYERPDQELLKREEGGIVRHSINPGKFVRILEMADVRAHQLETIIHCTTEGDLKDRGKSDGIGKAIVILQTLWFVAQCIARGLQQLPLTELEIVTLAYAMMNFFIYFFWWDKPRDVRSPVRVYETVTTSYTPGHWDDGLTGVLQRLLAYIIGNQDKYVLLSKQRKVPMFWSSTYHLNSNTPVLDDRTVTGALLGPSILGMAFGAIHFIAWWHGFPSHAGFILWRMSCIALVAVPLISTIACGVFTIEPSNILGLIGFIAFFLLMLSAWIYVVARFATIVIAFTALKSPPSDALLVVDWTTFIPHL